MSVGAKNKLTLIPLGGLGERGKNMLLLETDRDILVIDCGLMIPEEELLGIDYVIPDISYLLENKEKVRGVVVTHGHDGHIGALPYLLRQLNVPVFGTSMTLGIAAMKLRRAGLGTGQLKKVNPGEVFELGGLKVELVTVSHTLPGAVAVVISTPCGRVVHTGDFHFDQTPPNGNFTDIHRLAELGREGVLLLLSDSSNAEVAGFSPSERDPSAAIRSILRSARGRVIMVGYGASLYRLEQVVAAALEFGRRTYVAWPEGLELLELARRIGHLTFPPEGLFDPAMDKVPLREQVIIVPGFESLEPLAGVRANGRGTVPVQADDAVVLVAPPGPGSEKLVARNVDNLFKVGAEVYPELTSWRHAFGHASREELKLMLNLVRPRFFVPIHGEYRQLVWHARIAGQVGVPADNIFVVENGTSVELTAEKARIANRITAGKVLVDGLGVGDVGNIVLRDRKQLSQDGILIVVVTMDKQKGQLVAGPDIVSRGFVYVREAEELLEEAKERVRQALEKCETAHATEWSTIKSQVRDTLGKFLFERTRRRPMILPIIMEV
ncbi:MAG TPA: ribonuclease J [Firmicutes bacterium]|nr:ribonuclease J [Bacillota bacterium]